MPGETDFSKAWRLWTGTDSGKDGMEPEELGSRTKKRGRGVSANAAQKDFLTMSSLKGTEGGWKEGGGFIRAAKNKREKAS